VGSHGVTCHPAEVTFPPYSAVQAYITDVGNIADNIEGVGREGKGMWWRGRREKRGGGRKRRGREDVQAKARKSKEGL